MGYGQGVLHYPIQLTTILTPNSVYPTFSDAFIGTSKLVTLGRFLYVQRGKVSGFNAAWGTEGSQNFSGTFSRSGTNLNHGEFKFLKHKKPVRYVIKYIKPALGVKEPVWSQKLGRFVNHRVPGASVARFVPVYEKSQKKLIRLHPGTSLKPNTLTYYSGRFLDRGTINILAKYNDVMYYSPLRGSATYPVSTKIRLVGNLESFNHDLLNCWFFNQLISDLVPDLPSLGMSFRGEPFFSSFASDISSLDEVALRRFYSKLKNQKLDLATDLAEVGQTIGLISDLAIQLGKSFLLLKKGRLIEAISSLIPKSKVGVSNVFLAYRYGVAPLMSDIDGAMQHLAESIQSVPPMTVRARSTKKFVSSESIGGRTVSTTRIVTVKYISNYRLTNEALSNLSRLGFTSPANVAWELTPFSFIFDWFYPYGNYLGSLSALHGLTLTSLTRSTSVREVKSVSSLLQPIDLAASGGGWVFDEKSCSWKIEDYCMKREVLSPLDLPDLPTPSFKNPFSTGHVANAIALVIQFFKPGGN